ncbi:choice-of-anchor P family protein [Saccharothrix sp. BKS2]|uniref:choice-of-anchor P family protein n=1 Tax=Saccharothrix sp. BKS2 TaxID=3064400 RepID=UPI0039E901BC
MAGALGQWAGGDPVANHAVTAYTAGNPGAGKVQLRTEQPIPPAAPDRFLTFSVDAAERNCFANHALFEFYLVDGSTAIPTSTTPIEPCANPSTVIGGTARVGLDAPGCASVRFTPPVLVFDAHAHGGRLTAPLVGVGPLAPSDLSCTTQPGLDVDQLLGAVLPGIGSLGVVDTEARGVVDGDGERTATAHARTAGVALLGGLVTADEIRARAAAAEDATGAVTTAGGVELVNLRVNGVPVVNPAVDLTITVPLVATVVVNEQRSLAGGAGVAVNAPRVRLLTGTELVISHARVTLTRPGAPCPTS